MQINHFNTLHSVQEATYMVILIVAEKKLPKLNTLLILRKHSILDIEGMSWNLTDANMSIAQRQDLSDKRKFQRSEQMRSL